MRYTSPAGIVFNYAYSSTATNSFTFTVPVSATRYLTTSDSRLKSNVQNLEGAGERLFELTPVSYKLAVGPATYTAPEKAAVSEPMKETASSVSSSEESTIAEYGFIAQEVKEIFPDLVVEREDGVLMIDYQGMIPLLVDALGSLREQVRQQQETIEMLTHPTQRQKAVSGVSSVSMTDNSLGQNRPNPTTGASVIDITLSPEVGEAFVAFYDLTGKQLRRYDLRERGKITLTISEGEYPAGLYVYSLIADGQEVQTRRMIISE